MKFILGQKIAMTQVYGERGEVIPVTAVKVGPCVVTQVKTQDRDGYTAVQVGFGEKKRASQALRGHFGATFTGKEGRGFRFVKEFRLDTPVAAAVPGAVIDASSFAVGDMATVVGTSKGRGFAGVVKRHHFRGHPTSHGHKDQERMPGSIGAGGIQHVFKGQRMGGHMGDARVTVKNLPIVAVDPEQGVVMLKGALPGARNGLVEIRIEKGEMAFGSLIEMSNDTHMENETMQNEAEEVVTPVAAETAEVAAEGMTEEAAPVAETEAPAAEVAEGEVANTEEAAA